MYMRNSNRRKGSVYLNKRLSENDLGDDDDDEQITTTVGNKIYYYDSISKKNILNLIMELEEMNSKLTKESQLYSFEPYIELHIHSGGGELHAGLSAYDILKKNKIPIYTYIEGEACSAATLLALVELAMEPIAIALVASDLDLTPIATALVALARESTPKACALTSFAIALTPMAEALTALACALTPTANALTSFAKESVPAA